MTEARAARTPGGAPASAPEPPRILVADADPEARRWLRALVGAGGERVVLVLDEVESAAAALARSYRSGAPRRHALPVDRREGKGTVHDRQTESPEVFDREQASEATCGDPELLKEIVGIFLEDCPRMVEELERALDAADSEAVRRAAHTLKGSVSVVGAKALAAAAKEAEDGARAGDLDAAAAAFARVQEEAKRLVPALKELLAG